MTASIRAATPGEVGRWDELVAANPDGGHILQTRAWGEFKAGWRWTPRYTVAQTDEGQVATLFLSRRMGPLGELWYAPKGPGVLRAPTIAGLLGETDIFKDAFLIQVESELTDDAAPAELAEAGLRKARHDVQITRATVIVNLEADEDSLLAGFKAKTRYNIRLAQRKGVQVQRYDVDDQTCDVMYRLMAATQARAEFTLRSRQYFEDYWRLQFASDQGQFFFASVGDEVVAGVFVTYFGRRGWYKDGGSTRKHSELMAPYLLQWEVMRWLKARGATAYDLVAVPRSSELSEAHPLYGLWRFKSGFCEQITEFVGTWELPIRPKAVQVWDKVGSRLAHQWSYRRHRDLLY